MVSMIEALALRTLGPAPVRTGRAPKRLLMYRATEPFGRVRLHLVDPAGTEHLIEVLAVGQQYLVAGTHPSGAVYTWSTDDLAAERLTGVSLADVDRFLTAVERMVASTQGWTYRRGGTGVIRTDASGDQNALLAPSVDAVASLVKQIPNAPPQFGHRDDYLKMGYAIKAACGSEHEEEALLVWAEWGARWTHPEKKHKPRRAFLADWRRMSGPYVVGWGWLLEQARIAGVNVAGEVFSVVEDAPPLARDTPRGPLFGTEHWLAWRAVRLIGHQLRFIPANGKWYVWDAVRWQPDSVKLAEAKINEMLIAESHRIIDEAQDDKVDAATKMARQWLTAGKAAAVRKLLESDRNIALRAESLDTNLWILNTPTGIVDLKTGAQRVCNPEDLCSKVTSVGVGEGLPEKWLKFLHEACGGDEDMVRYLHKVAGYILTGVTTEQSFWFLWGSGGNGKSMFIDTLQGILKDYSVTATMDALSASQNDRHSTDLAAMAGARLVTTSETAAGKRWDEQRIKSLTGGGMVSARFLYGNNFEFQPQFKILISGNHQPGLRDVDNGMKRRLKLVPFTNRPAVPNQNLFEELKDEWPQILRWMVEGCVLWAKEGMMTPEAVKAETDDYFDEEDSFGRFIDERCVVGSTESAYTSELFDAWREWAGENNAYVGDSKRLASALHARGFARRRGTAGKRGFTGIGINTSTFGVVA